MLEFNLPRNELLDNFNEKYSQYENLTKKILCYSMYITNITTLIGGG